jgi:ankyrin repeat protein
MMYASSEGHMEIVKLLIAANANVNEKDEASDHSNLI